MKLAAFVTRLEGVKKDTNGFCARCPAHEDKRQSLSVTQGDKGIVLKCHAGCGTADVLDALGLKLKDLFPPKENGQRVAAPRPRPAKPAAKQPTPSKEGNGQTVKPRIVAEYDYLDETGVLLFQVVRFAPKDFRQRRPDPDAKGGWNWSTKDTRKVLFKLPDLIKNKEWLSDAKDDCCLWIVEGEKDVLALMQAGCVATCNPGGAGKWSDAYTAALAAVVRIIIVADKDEPGRKHAQTVAAALARTARVVKIIEVPTGKDVAEYLSTGGGTVALRKLADEAPAVMPHAAPAVPAVQPGTSQTTPDLPPCVFSTLQQRYFIPAGNEWIPVNDTRTQTYFKQRGFSAYNSDALGVTVLETAMQRVVIERNVAFAGEVAGHWPGPCEISGNRFLVTRGPRMIQPKSVPWTTLQTLLEDMLLPQDDAQETLPGLPPATRHTIQWELFCGWVWTSYQSLRDKTFRSGQILGLVGKSDSGKSFLQSLITDVLGGRSANPYPFLVGTTDFNADLVGAEHLMIDDDASERDMKSRITFGQRLKKLCVQDKVKLHAKGKDGVQSKAFTRLTICLNDGPDDLQVLPPMDEAIKRKFVLLKIFPGRFPDMTQDPLEFVKFRSKIVAELPGFLHYLETQFKLPEELHSARFGVTHWQHPDIILELEAFHPWQRIVELVDHCRPWGGVDEVTKEPVDRDYWEGTAMDLEEVLRERARSRADSVLRGPASTGRDLASAMERLPHRIGKRTSMGRTVWIIKRSSE